jgi:transposase
MKYEGRGKPKAGAEKVVTGYYIKASFTRSTEVIAKIINSKGRFILATNNLDITKTSDEEMLSEYKEQQNVESGFRFLKDPWFMVDSVFLKLPRRVEALMMVMTLCLMVYNVAQYRLREALKLQAETWPNQLGKATNKPTIRWVFQIMEGIGIVRFFKKNIVQPVKELLTNLNVLRRKIIFLMGENVVRMYGLKQYF